MNAIRRLQKPIRVNTPPTMNEACATAGKKGNYRVHQFRQLRHFACVFAVIAVAVMGTAHAAEPLRAEPESLERAAPELIERLRADPTIISASSAGPGLRVSATTWAVICATCQLCGCTATRMSSSSRCSGMPGGSMTSTTPPEAWPWSISCGSWARSISWLVDAPGKRIVTRCSIDSSKAISRASLILVIYLLLPTS